MFGIIFLMSLDDLWRPSLTYVLGKTYAN